MKGIVILGVIGIAVGLGIYGYTNYEASRDRGHLIAFACGNLKGDTVEIQIAIPYRMTRLDPPRSTDKRRVLWAEWVEEHFDLHTNDEARTRVELRRAHFANLIPQAKVGTPDFYLTGRLKVGATYALDYLPIGVAESKRYRKVFPITTEGKPFARDRFGLVEED